MLAVHIIGAAVLGGGLPTDWPWSAAAWASLPASALVALPLVAIGVYNGWARAHQARRQRSSGVQ